MKLNLLRFLPLFAAAVVLLTGCTRDDDIDDLLRQTEEHAKQLAEHEKRISELETWTKTANTEIAALQTLVNALEQNDYITGVLPVMEEGKEIGYTITFLKNDPITVYHGKKGDKGDTGATGQTGEKGETGAKGDTGEAGSDGLTPLIGVWADEDGIYWWTVQMDGDEVKFIVDASGDPVRASGIDGVTPKIKIEGGTWWISPDGTASGFSNTGINAIGPRGATGAQGAKGDSMFDSVDADTYSDYVLFTLENGTDTFQVPKYKAMNVTVPAFSSEFTFGGSAQTVTYTLGNGSVTPTIVKAFDVPDGWKLTINKDSKQITVTPDRFTDRWLEEQEVLLLFSDGGDHTVFKTLTVKPSALEEVPVGTVYYENGAPVGVVARAKTGDAATTRGLILHKDEYGTGTGVKWADDGYNAGDGWSWNDATGTASSINGWANQQKIMAIDNWGLKYPGFKWCADRGDEWYLPGFSETVDVLRAMAQINPRLKEISGIELANSDIASYWCSDERSGEQAMIAHMFMGEFAQGTNVNKNTTSFEGGYLAVRAVKNF